MYLRQTYFIRNRSSPSMTLPFLAVLFDLNIKRLTSDCFVRGHPNELRYFSGEALDIYQIIELTKGSLEK